MAFDKGYCWQFAIGWHARGQILPLQLGTLAQFSANCAKHHCISSKRIPMYLKGTLDL